MSGLPTFAYAATVVDRQKRLAAALKATDDSVQACPALPDATRAGWGQFYTTVMAFCREDVGWYQGFLRAGAMVDQSEAYGSELFAWQQRLSTWNCASANPVFDPNAASAMTPATTNLLQWGMYATLAIAGAYVVGKVVGVIPKPASR
jgi:hypothetical protein